MLLKYTQSQKEPGGIFFSTKNMPPGSFFTMMLGIKYSELKMIDE